MAISMDYITLGIANKLLHQCTRIFGTDFFRFLAEVMFSSGGTTCNQSSMLVFSSGLPRKT